MNEDPRCCGSGVCIIDTEGRCWCGQQWDGQKMCSPPLAAGPAEPGAAGVAADAASPEGPVAGSTGSAAAWAAGAALLLAGLGTPAPAQAQAETAARAVAVQPVPAVLIATQAGPTTAAAPSAEQARAMQAVVQAQLEAFKAGDAQRAYSLASPAIQQQFGDAQGFFSMVRSAYPMLIAPSSLAWRLPEPAPGGAVQPVQLRDRQGRAWLATYQLQAQADGSWRISGCIVVPDEQHLSA